MVRFVYLQEKECFLDKIISVYSVNCSCVWKKLTRF